MLALVLLLGTIATAGCAPSAGPVRPGPAGSESVTSTYLVYVGAESADLIHRIRLDAQGVAVDQTTPVGEMAVETEGPHGLNISPDGEYLYMTTAHGIPDGKLWKFHAGPDTLVADPILLGNFPATLDLTPDGLYALVVNFNLHGEMVPSSVSVVYTPDPVEVEQIGTCVMPHGLRLEPSGIFAYSNCMMDDQLVEIDTRSFEVSRRFSVEVGDPGPIENYDVGELVTGAKGLTSSGSMARGAMGAMEMPMHDPSCSPTWVQPSPDGTRLFVACNKGNEIMVIDRMAWTIEHRISTGAGPYNLGITPDGSILVASLKTAGQVEFFDAETKFLRFTTFIQAIFLNQPFGQGSTRAFANQGVFAAQLHARLVHALLRAIARYAHIAGDHTFDDAIFLNEFSRWKAWIYLHAHGFGLISQPTAQIAQRTRIATVIVQEGRQSETRQGHGARFTQHHKDILADLGIKRQVGVLAPIRHQFVQRPGIKDDAREDMRANFRAFFKDCDGQIPTRLFTALFQTDSRRKARRSGPYDDHIIVHGFAHNRPVGHAISYNRDPASAHCDLLS